MLIDGPRLPPEIVTSTKLEKERTKTMTLKQALNVISEARYSIVVHDNDGYETIKIDYVHDDKCSGGSFSKAFEKREEVLKTKNRVNWISYNNALNMIEISIDVMA